MVQSTCVSSAHSKSGGTSSFSISSSEHSREDIQIREGQQCKMCSRIGWVWRGVCWQDLDSILSEGNSIPLQNNNEKQPTESEKYKWLGIAAALPVGGGGQGARMGMSRYLTRDPDYKGTGLCQINNGSHQLSKSRELTQSEFMFKYGVNIPSTSLLS